MFEMVFLSGQGARGLSRVRNCTEEAIREISSLRYFKIFLILRILKSILCEYNFMLKMTYHNSDLFF